MTRQLLNTFLLCWYLTVTSAFAPSHHQSLFPTIRNTFNNPSRISKLHDAADAVDAVTDTIATNIDASQMSTEPALAVPDVVDSVSQLQDVVPDLDTIALVVGQENYGLAVVLLGEGIWSLSKAPSIDHALKTIVPAAVAAAVLVLGSGPMVTSGNTESVGTGLAIATVVSILMGMVYLARCLAPFSPSPKEIPALGVLVAVAGFFSFSQNLVVDGFVTLPSLPSVNLPSLPTIQLPF